MSGFGQGDPFAQPQQSQTASQPPLPTGGAKSIPYPVTAPISSAGNSSVGSNPNPFDTFGVIEKKATTNSPQQQGPSLNELATSQGPGRNRLVSQTLDLEYLNLQQNNSQGQAQQQQLLAQPSQAVPFSAGSGTAPASTDPFGQPTGGDPFANPNPSAFVGNPGVSQMSPNQQMPGGFGSVGSDPFANPNPNAFVGNSIGGEMDDATTRESFGNPLPYVPKPARPVLSTSQNQNPPGVFGVIPGQEADPISSSLQERLSSYHDDPSGSSQERENGRERDKEDETRDEFEVLPVLGEGEVLGRLSTRSMAVKDWKSVYYVLDERHLYLFRARSDYTDFPLHSEKYKSKIDIKPSLRCVKIKKKDYVGFGLMPNFMLEDVLDYGAVNVAKFASMNADAIETLHGLLTSAVTSKRQEKDRVAYNY